MQNQKVYTVEEVQKKLEHYCAYQERCHQEVIQKLRQFKMIPSAIDRIIGYLIEHNYLNETRFAKSFARGKFRIKKWGKERLLRELKQRNISSYNIRLALKEIPEDDYLKTIEELATKFWLSNASRQKQIQKKKVFDALRYRGWESELVYREIKRLEDTSLSIWNTLESGGNMLFFKKPTEKTTLIAVKWRE